MKRQTAVLLGLLCIVLGKVLPPVGGLSPAGMQVLGIFAGVLIMWLTIAIHWPSLLGIAMLATVPGLNLNKLLAVSVGNSTFSFLLFTFMCTYALSKTPFVKRCAIGFICSKIARKGSWWFLISYCASVLIIGMVMSPAVLFVIYLPILDAICQELQLKNKDSLTNSLVLGQLICAEMSCGMTPIAHVFPIMALGFYSSATGRTIAYGDYMLFAVPVGVICFIALMLIFRFVLRPDMSKIANLDFDALQKTVPPMGKYEKTVLGICSLVVVMWIVPGFLKSSFPGIYQFFKVQGTAFPPLVGASLLCLLTLDGKPLLDFKEVVSKGVDWSSIIMAAGTLALGAAMTNKSVGITAWIISSIAPILQNASATMLIVFIIAWASIQTNVSSNMVTVTVVTAIAIPLCNATNGAVNTAVICALIGMIASYAYATPPAHPAVALAIGSEKTTTGQVLKLGIAMMVIAIAVTVLVGYPLGVVVLGA